MNRLLDLEGLRRELNRSMWLLFIRDMQDKDSLKLLWDLFVSASEKRPGQTGYALAILRFIPSGMIDDSDRTHLQDFELFRSRLAYIKQRMKDWKPSKFSQLLRPGYFDRLTWFTAMFGVLFGLIGAFSLVISIISIALAVVAWKYPV
jgi:hypothetical protein